MVTAKKETKPKVAKQVKETEEVLYTIPVEVKEWIEYAQSRISYLKSQVDRLKEENDNLKKYQKFAQTRILKSDYE